jgi:phosphatidylserine/phosphatidylglycerophosphate/cardiolipin synthase-like enzyme
MIFGVCSADILINEIMYDPVLSDNYYEWIELYNPNNYSVNLSNWSITDNTATELLVGDFSNGNGSTIIHPRGYAIITDHGTKIYDYFSIPNQTIKLFVDDSSIGNGLGNDGDKIILKNKTGDAIDTVEWIENYSDVPGLPSQGVLEGSSLSRFENTDDNNSLTDFFECKYPTPGCVNKFQNEPKIGIEQYPKYIPKVQNKCKFSHPFGIKINLTNYPPNESYQIKSYIVGSLKSKYPASQTWHDSSWEYSYYYTEKILTNQYGKWTGWQYLRFNKEYGEYKKRIKNNSTAYLIIKVKNDNISIEILKELFLLDMDDSTSNGTIGGCAIGSIISNYSSSQGKTAIIENNSGIITGIYLTENNNIDEGFIPKSGYFKIASSVGTNYTLKFFDNDGYLIHSIYNLTINPGIFEVKLFCENKNFKLRKNETIDIPISINNTGDFFDTYNIKIVEISENLHAFLKQKNLSIHSSESKRVYLHIQTNRIIESTDGYMIISATSTGDIGVSYEIKLNFEILVPDLTIRKIKTYNEKSVETSILGEGEVVRIKAFFKNYGNINASNINVNFYLDSKDEYHLIGKKNYDSIGKYQKYPSILWDTKNVAFGNHTIIVIADQEKLIDESNEENNELSFEIEIFNSYPYDIGKQILITQAYYYPYPGLHNEYLSIHNPANVGYNISGWYITKNPSKFKLKQSRIVFPEGTFIPANTSLFLTENASSFVQQTSNSPDFEYNYDSMEDIAQMQSKMVKFSNLGGIIALKDCFNHTIDLIVYGEVHYSSEGWNKPPIKGTAQGEVLRRNIDLFGKYIDTNSSEDWTNPRVFRIGQSSFSYEELEFSGEIQTFVSPDCSYNVITRELKSAKQSINLNLYEFTNSFLSEEIIMALIRNVSVNIFLEGSPIGGICKEEKYILNRIANYGGNIRFIVSDAGKKVYSRYRFNHAKYLVIDNKTTIIESCNWANTGVPREPSYGNREWGIIIKNDTIARFFLTIFQDDFNSRRCDSYSFYDMKIDVSSKLDLEEFSLKGVYKPRFESKSYSGNFTITPVISPDTSYEAIINLINSAKDSIFIEQLYIYKNWSNGINPFVESLIDKSNSGVDIRVILNYNPFYTDTNEKCQITKKFLEENGIKVKFIYSNWSIFSNIHNKGMVVDNRSVLVSSINWNENSVTQNREVGIIIDSTDVAKYYANVFLYDWNLGAPKNSNYKEQESLINYKNTIYIVILFTLTFTLIARDWRNRKWT